jgi:hypothetical protein
MPDAGQVLNREKVGRVCIAVEKRALVKQDGVAET